MGEFDALVWGVSNGLCEHLRACEQCVYFCEHEQLSNCSCKQPERALSKNTDGDKWALRVLSKFSASWNLSFIIGYVVLRQVIPNNLVDISKKKRPKLGRFNQFHHLTANWALLDAELRHVASPESECEHASSCKQFASTSKRAPV